MSWGYAGPGWEWPKADNWHRKSLSKREFNEGEDVSVGGFPISTNLSIGYKP
jgi:hypothetical protein